LKQAEGSGTRTVVIQRNQVLIFRNNQARYYWNNRKWVEKVEKMCEGKRLAMFGFACGRIYNFPKGCEA